MVIGYFMISWIPDGASKNRYGTGDLGFNNYPKRTKYKRLFSELGQ